MFYPILSELLLMMYFEEKSFQLSNLLFILCFVLFVF